MRAHDRTERVHRGMAALALGAWLLGPGTLPAAAQSGPPKIIHARVETRSAVSGLEAELRAFLAAQESPAWMGYAVPAIEGSHQSCCWNNSAGSGRPRDAMGCGRCALESRDGNGFTDSESNGGTARLEAPQEILVLLRAADHRVSKVRVFTPDCELDAGDLRVLWLIDVKPAESVAVLSTLVTAGAFDGGESRAPAHGALMAIAMHADPAADRALESFVAPSQPEKLRSQTSFWLGSARRAAGLRLLERMAKSDPSTKVRAQVAFAYSTSKEPAAVDDLIRMAKDDESGHVRGQALFWLAQKAGKRASGAIVEAIENDPDTAMKRSAVFALSQLPRDEGVPLLIQVARSNKNPDVRKQAFFWLGQTNDPRALAFFEEVLRSR
jgi:HEAT repeat protein